MREGSRGSIWASSSRTRWPGPQARRCWCRGGRSAPSTGCTWPTGKGRRKAVARPAPPGPGRKARGGGGTTGAAAPWPRRGTGGGSARPSAEAAKTVITWAVTRRIGALAVGDPRGVLKLKAGRRHNQRTRDWRIGHLITVLKDKAEAAGIGLTLVDERGTSSTCPACGSRVPKPAGRVLACPACQFTGHRDPHRGRQYRRPTRRRDHAGRAVRRVAPPRRGAPARCRSLAT